MEMNSVEDLVSQSIKKKSDNISVVSESIFGEGKLLIDLKIAKDGGEEVKKNIEDWSIGGLLHKDRQMSKNSICNLCNKTFTSGKALEGHMRIHAQKGTKKKNLIFKNKLISYQSVKFKKQNTRAEDDRMETDSVKKNECEKKKYPTADNCTGAANIDKRPSCPVCLRVFPSLKSVFGHMRIHSNRKWRGIRPPSVEKTSSTSCLSYDEETHKTGDLDELLSDIGKDGRVDLTANLWGWSSTARRGRKHSSLEMDDLLLKELEALASLLMLAGGDFESGLVHRQKDDEFGDEHEEKDYSVSLNDDIKNLGSKMLIKNKKKRKKVKLSDLQQPQNATPEKLVAVTATSPFSEKYRCGDSCEKSFQTPQAFGGHISGHNKCTVVIENVILKFEKPSNPGPQMEETKEIGPERSRSLQEIDLNKLPPSEFEV